MSVSNCLIVLLCWFKKKWSQKNDFNSCSCNFLWNNWICHEISGSTVTCRKQKSTLLFCPLSRRDWLKMFRLASWNILGNRTLIFLLLIIWNQFMCKMFFVIVYVCYIVTSFIVIVCMLIVFCRCMCCCLY